MAALHDNPRLINWVNGQPLALTLTCLGDGHDGVWNIIGAFATPAAPISQLRQVNRQLNKLTAESKYPVRSGRPKMSRKSWHSGQST
jgi:hypothetical protein